MRYLTGRLKEDGQFYYENASDAENVLIAFRNQRNGLTIAVSEEHPVDSYNATFECAVYIPTSHALLLRDYLLKEFPLADNGTTP